MSNTGGPSQSCSNVRGKEMVTQNLLAGNEIEVAKHGQTAPAGDGTGNCSKMRKGRAKKGTENKPQVRHISNSDTSKERSFVSN